MSKRIQRVNQLIKREISQILLREIEFPSAILVTITQAQTSADLRDVDILLSVIPEKETENILNFLNSKIYVLQQKLNKRLKMRPLPKIKFFEEKKTAEAGRIEELLEGLKREGK